MKETRLGAFELFALITSFLLSNTLTVSGSASTKEKYGYITIFFAFLMFLLLIKIYCFIFENSDSGDFYGVLKNNFSKRIYGVILFFVFLFSLFSAVMSSLNLMFFVTVSSGGKINLAFMGILLCVCLFSIMTKSKRVLAKYCGLTIFGIFFLFSVMLLFGFQKGNFVNIADSFSLDAFSIAKSTFLNFLSPFSDIFFIYLFLHKLCGFKKIAKYAKASGLCAAVILSGVYLVNLVVLGKNLMSDIYYPTLFSFGIINPVNKISRSEIIYYSSHLFFDIIYVAVSLFVCRDSFFRLFFEKEEIKNEEVKNKKSKRKEYVFSISCVSFILLYILISSFSGKFYNIYEKVSLLRVPLNIGLILVLFVKILIRKIHSKFISEKLM